MPSTLAHRVQTALLVALLLLPGLLPTAAATSGPAASPRLPAGATLPSTPLSQAQMAAPISLQDPHLADRLDAALAAAGLAPTDVPPVPQPTGPHPLADALDVLAAASGSSVDPQALAHARSRADALPPDLQVALARIVLANAEAMTLSQQSVVAGQADPHQVARAALLVARAQEASLPVLQRYAVLYGHGGATIPIEQARTVDQVVALATGSTPLAAPASSPPLAESVLELYTVLGIHANASDQRLLEAGAAALPDRTARAAALLADAEARSATLRKQAFANVTDAQLVLLQDPALPTRLADGPADLPHTEGFLRAYAAVDHAKIARADLLMVTAALQARSLLASGAPSASSAAPTDPLHALWNAVVSFLGAILPVGDARAAAPAPAGETCPATSPLSDCGNDVWFMDPFGIVVLSGYRTTVYDDRYGRMSLSDRGTFTFQHLPETISSSGAPRVGSFDPATLATQANATFHEANDAAGGDKATNGLWRPYYALTLDLGGNDVYVNQTASMPTFTARNQPYNFPGTLDGALAGNRTAMSNVTNQTGVVTLPPGLAGHKVADPDAYRLARSLPLLADVLVDLGGNDRYDARQLDPQANANLTVASAQVGFALLLDGAGNDVYRGGNESTGFAWSGDAFLLNLGGNDTFVSRNESQGFAFNGISLLLSVCSHPTRACKDGNDVYRSTAQFTQGAAWTFGTGALLDVGGNDTYNATGFYSYRALRSLSMVKHVPMLTQGATVPRAVVGGLGLFADVGGTRDTGIHPNETASGLGRTGGADGYFNTTFHAGQGTVGARFWVHDTANLGLGLALHVDHTWDPNAYLTPQGGGMLYELGNQTLPLLSLPGLFAFDGATNTVYDRPYAVTVDLAGNDRYLDNAGGVLPVRSNQTSADARTMGSALSLDLAGDDVYDATNLTSPTFPQAWGVQGAGNQGVGMLVDLGGTVDRYLAPTRAGGVAWTDDQGHHHHQCSGEERARAPAGAKDVHPIPCSPRASQGVARSGGVGLLLDDGSPGAAPDRFDAGYASQGAAVAVGPGTLLGPAGAPAAAGLGALLHLAGSATYRAGNRSQGFGDVNGTGILLDASTTPGVDDTTYEAGNLSQGAGLGGTGILVDLGGDDVYRAWDRSQGYGGWNATRAPPRSLQGQPVNRTQLARGILLDVAGRDRYLANDSAVAVHGFADRTPLATGFNSVAGNHVGGRGFTTNPAGTLALLLDLAPPNQDTATGGPDHVDDFIRAPPADVFRPVLTPWNATKGPGRYWTQPPTTLGNTRSTTSPSNTTRDASHLNGPQGYDPGSSAWRFGEGLDAPPAGLLHQGADGTYLALRALTMDAREEAGSTFPALGPLLTSSLAPNVTVTACERSHPDACASSGHPLQGPLTLEAHVGYGDPLLDALLLRAPGNLDGRTTATFVLERPGAAPAILGTSRLGFTGSPADQGARAPGGCSAPDANGTSCQADLSATVVLPFTNTTKLVEHALAPSVDGRAYPDGGYRLVAIVRNAGTFATNGRAEGHGATDLQLRNPAELLGMRLQDPNPDHPQRGAAFTFLTSARPTNVTVTVDGPSRTSRTLTGTVATTCGTWDGQRVCNSTLPWDGRVGGAFLPPGSYPYHASVRDNGTVSRTLSGLVVSDATPPDGDLNLTTEALGCPLVAGGCPAGVRNTTDPVTMVLPLRGTDADSGVRVFHVMCRVDGNPCESPLNQDRSTSFDVPALPIGGVAHAYGANLTLQDVQDGDQVALTVTAEDLAGNLGPARSHHLAVDTRRPYVETVEDPYTVVHGWQTSTTFPVGWANASSDLAALHLQVRVQPGDAGADLGPWRNVTTIAVGSAAFQAGVTTWNASRLGLDPGNLSGGSVLLRFRAEDRAGNLQVVRGQGNLPRLVRFDLEPLRIVGTPHVDRGLSGFTVTWTLDRNATLHRFQVDLPNGTRVVMWRNLTAPGANGATFTVTNLTPQVTYPVRLASRDAEGRWSNVVAMNVTTQPNLVASILSPGPDALVRGTVPVRWTAGSASIATGGDPTVRWALTLRGVAANGTPYERVLVPPTRLVLRAGADHPAEPQAPYYPTNLYTTRVPDGNATLHLVLSNALGTVAVDRNITVDNTPPTSPPDAVNLSGTRGDVVAGVPWFLSPVTVEGIAASDATTGVARTLVSVDGSNVTEVLDPAHPPQVSGDGLHVLRWLSVDRAGNVEPRVHRMVLGIDTGSPSASVLVDGGATVVNHRNVTLQVLLRDDDAGSGLQALRIGEAGDVANRSWTPVEPGRLTYPWTLSPGDGRKRLVVEVMDGAGRVGRGTVSVVLRSHPPALVGGLHLEQVGHTSAVLAYRTDQPSLTWIEVGRNDSFDHAVRPDDAFVVDHRVVLANLTPGTTYYARAVLEDSVGNLQRTPPVAVRTVPDVQPPTAVGDVHARDLGDGRVALAWSAAGDDVGLRGYRVLQVLANGTTRVVATPDAPQATLSELTPGETATLAVEAVDLAGNVGPRSAPVQVTPTTPPVLVGGRVSPDVGRAGDAFTFRVTYRDPDGDLPASVDLVVDGVRHAMLPSENATDARAGIAYHLTLHLNETSLQQGAHRYRFEANDGTQTTRFPTLQDATGPVVKVASGGGARSLAGAIVHQVPTSPAVLLAGLAAAALILRRRRS